MEPVKKKESMHKFAIAVMSLLPVQGFVTMPKFSSSILYTFHCKSFGFSPAHGSSGYSRQRFQRIPKRPQISLLSSQASVREISDYGFPTFITGPLYDGPAGCPKVTLFTKEECTLCDKVKAVLEQTRTARPHALFSVDIADPRNQVWWDRYKYDIPVLHVDGRYWIKHRLSTEEALAGLAEAAAGSFAPRQGDPDAKKMEHAK